MADDWYTPHWLVNALQEAVGGFDMDTAAGCEPKPIADTVITLNGVSYDPRDYGVSVIRADATTLPWEGTVFVNPPYSRYNIDAFAKKIYEESTRDDGPELILALLPARMSADWWHDYVTPADMQFVFKSRLRFGGANNDGGFASVLAAYGDVPPALIEALEETKTPAHPYKGHDNPGLANVYRGSVLQIETDLRGAAAPEGVDGMAEATVQTVSVSDDGLAEVLAVQRAENQDHETYFLLEFPVNDPLNIRCSICRGIQETGFRQVAIERVERVERSLENEDLGSHTRGKATA